MNDISEHCLCDHCSGQDCQVFTKEEQEQNQKKHDASIASIACNKMLNDIKKWRVDQEVKRNCGETTYKDMRLDESVFLHDAQSEKEMVK